jgi:hypothetical protein
MGGLQTIRGVGSRSVVMSLPELFPVVVFMEKNSRFTKVLSYQSFGFLAIITLFWLNSLLGLQSLILESRLEMADLKGPILQMLLILTVWLLVNASTRRILDNLRYLEKFMRVCSWCRRIDYNGQWMALEEFLRHGFDTPTTHGICSECLEKIGPKRAKRKGSLLLEIPSYSVGLTRLV